MIATAPNLARLRSARVLLVEDEFLLALAVQEDLNRAGCDVVGPIGSLEAALTAARTEPLQAAVIDVNLNGVIAYELADALIARQVPVLLLTGYGRADLPERLRNVPKITKPHDPQQLLDQLAKMVPASP